MRATVRSAPAWWRLVIAYHVLKPVRSRYVAVFEDSQKPDAPAAVLRPAPEWMAAALHGGVVPPLDAILRDKARSFAWGERPESWDAPPIGPMTEEQAMEYCIMACVPRHIWDAPPGNRRRLVICTADRIPTDRTLREAWEIADPCAGAIGGSSEGVKSLGPPLSIGFGPVAAEFADRLVAVATCEGA